MPDATFHEATKRATELRMSRSEFFSRAARKYLDDLSRDSLTYQINHALKLGGDDDSSAAAAHAGRRRAVADSDW